jgi:hypothetical protein
MINITKSSLCLIDDCYRHPKTSTLIFRFEPQFLPSTEERLGNTELKHASIEGKEIYILDHFFLDSEEKEMRSFSETATFSRNSYGSPEAIERGETPARSMNGNERWKFFSHPPQAIAELYKLFSTIAFQLNADITTLPWELCDQTSHGSPAVIANKLENASKESRELGKHQDCNPQGRISFGIPVLYSEKEEYHPKQFLNGDTGKPWLITAMVYATAENFKPEYRLGTVFYDDRGELSLSVHCSHMRLILFESDIFHSIEESQIPQGEKSWRISYVFKLIVNPREKEQNLKAAFHERFKQIPRFNTLENRASLGV